MEVRFRTRALEQHYVQSAKAERIYGREVARKYIQRVNILKATRNLDALMRQTTLRCHRLQGDLKGLYSIRLHGRWRLIVSFQSEAMDIVRIEEVSHHYGD